MKWNEYIIDAKIKLTPTSVAKMIFDSLLEKEIVEFAIDLISSMPECYQREIKEWLEGYFDE